MSINEGELKGLLRDSDINAYLTSLSSCAAVVEKDEGRILPWSLLYFFLLFFERQCQLLFFKSPVRDRVFLWTQQATKSCLVSRTNTIATRFLLRYLKHSLGMLQLLYRLPALIKDFFGLYEVVARTEEIYLCKNRCSNNTCRYR